MYCFPIEKHKEAGTTMEEVGTEIHNWAIAPGGGTHYNRGDPPERGPLFRLEVYKRVRIFRR